MMAIPIRDSVKVILINEGNEILLLCVDDPTITDADGTYKGRFWCLVGGGIEHGESIQTAALREIHEETGLSGVQLGPIVWHSEIKLILKNVLTLLKEQFIVARTQQKDVVLTKPSEWEKQAVKKLAWFSIDMIKKGNEIIYPIALREYLPAILAGNYPEKPIIINSVQK